MKDYDYIYQSTDEQLACRIENITFAKEDGRIYMLNPEEAETIIREATRRLRISRQRDIVVLAKETRDAQKAYFATRSYGDLDQSKQLERRLDKAIETYLNPPQPDLFS